MRLRCIREAGDEIRESVHRKIQWLWENPAQRWNDGQDVKIIIPLHRKGDKKTRTISEECAYCQS